MAKPSNFIRHFLSIFLYSPRAHTEWNFFVICSVSERRQNDGVDATAAAAAAAAAAAEAISTAGWLLSLPLIHWLTSQLLTLTIQHLWDV